METEPKTEEQKQPTVEELLKLIDNIKGSQRGSDLAYQKEKARADALQEKLVKGIAEAELIARLDRIDKASADHKRALEIRFYAKEKCLDSGVPFELIADIPFKDFQAVEKKVAQIAEAVTARSLDELDRRLGQSVKPMAGNSQTSKAKPFSLEGFVNDAMKAI